MAKVVVGSGEYKGYLIPEVPDELLERLLARFPLDARDYDLSDSEKLLITVAVHQESNRRRAGGRVQLHIPSVRELASDIVRKGFRDLSKVHHPDKNGQEEAQKRLSAARDQLFNLSGQIEDEVDPDAVWVDDPRNPEIGLWQVASEITDDDVPF